VTTKTSYYSLVEMLLEAKVITWDLETQSNAKGSKGNMEDWHPHSRLVSASFTTDEGTAVVPLSHPEGPWTGKTDPWDADAKWRLVYHNLCKAMIKSEAKLVAHNAKYEVRWSNTLAGYALETQVWWDTMMSAYLLDENESASLKAVAVRDLGVDEWADVDLRDAEAVPWDALALYNARDTDYTHRLVPVHRKQFQVETRLARLFYFHSMPLIRTLAGIERTGLPLDTKRVKEMQVESKDIVKTYGDKLLAIATGELGMDLDEYPTVSFGTTNKFFTAFMEEANVPVISVSEKTGNPSWSADNLETAADMGHPLATDILLVRKHSNRQSKFFTPWLREVSEGGRLHPSFNPMLVDDKYEKPKGTKTGRLSSSGQLNAQQIARDLKVCFGGEEGWLFAELDYSQIELRIAAWLANVTRVLDAYEREEDLHVLMAMLITGKDAEHINKDERQKGKAGNFGFLFEMGESTYLEYVRTNYKIVIDLAEARNTRRAFFNDQWPGLEQWHERQKVIARKFGFVRNPIGRKRRLPEIYSGNYGLRGRAERRAINSPIQSFAADLMCLALSEIHQTADPERVRLVGTVHDSLLAQVREDTWEQDVEHMARTMLNPGVRRKFGVKIGVPLAVEAHIGYHWNSPEGQVRVYS